MPGLLQLQWIYDGRAYSLAAANTPVLVATLAKDMRLGVIYFRTNPTSGTDKIGLRIVRPGQTSAVRHRFAYGEFTGPGHHWQADDVKCAPFLPKGTKIYYEATAASNNFVRILGWDEREVVEKYVDPSALRGLRPELILQDGYDPNNASKTWLDGSQDQDYRIICGMATNKENAANDFSIGLSHGNVSARRQTDFANKTLAAYEVDCWWEAKTIYHGLPLNKGDRLYSWTNDADQLAFNVTVVPENQIAYIKKFW